MPPALRAQSPNHWTTREVPYLCLFLLQTGIRLCLLQLNSKDGFRGQGVSILGLKVNVKVAQSCLTLCDLMDYNSPYNSPGQNSGVGSLKPSLIWKSYQKSVCDLLAARCSKANKTAQAGGKESLLYFRCWQLGAGEGGHLSKGRLPAPSGNQWGKRFYRQKEGATCRNRTVSSDSHLQIGHWWSDLHHLGCFRYS